MKNSSGSIMLPRPVSGSFRSAQRFLELIFITMSLLLDHVLLSLNQESQLITCHFVELLIRYGNGNSLVKSIWLKPGLYGNNLLWQLSSILPFHRLLRHTYFLMYGYS